jgi:hypothetical protein
MTYAKSIKSACDPSFRPTDGFIKLSIQFYDFPQQEKFNSAPTKQENVSASTTNQHEHVNRKRLSAVSANTDRFSTRA